MYALAKCKFEVQMGPTRWQHQWVEYDFMDGMIHEYQHMISIHFQDRTYLVLEWVLKRNILGDVVHVPLIDGHCGCLETQMGVSKWFHEES